MNGKIRSQKTKCKLMLKLLKKSLIFFTFSVKITYIDKNGKPYEVKGKVGDNVLYLAHRYGIEMEGACEASLACTTCHVYVDEKYLDKLPEADEKEEDLLDMAVFISFIYLFIYVFIHVFILFISAVFERKLTAWLSNYLKERARGYEASTSKSN